MKSNSPFKSFRPKAKINRLRHKLKEPKAMSETKNAYVERQTENIKSWNAEIHKFQDQADRAIGKKVAQYKKHIEELKTMRTGLEEKVAEIQKNSEAGWEELKVGAEKAFKTLDKSFKTAKAYFN
jgi:chromosome segregation ATPase